MNCFGSKCPHRILNKLQTNLLQLTGKVLFHFELVRLSGSFVCHRYHMVLLKQGSILSSSKIFFGRKDTRETEHVTWPIRKVRGEKTKPTKKHIKGAKGIFECDCEGTIVLVCNYEKLKTGSSRNGIPREREWGMCRGREKHSIAFWPEGKL